VQLGESRRWATLAERFDPRHNSLNVIRLALATSVIVSHSWPLSGGGGAPAVGNQFLGDIAVDGFFAISGFLILGSRLNSHSLVDFFWRRFLRIWPAFIVVLVFVAFVVAPVTVFALKNGAYDAVSAITYVLKNLSLVIVQPGIESTPVGIPEVGNWNAPLWTLAYEFACYIGIALVVTVVAKRLLGVTLAMLLAGATALNLVTALSIADLPDPLVVLARLGAFFLAGSMIYHVRERIPLSHVGGALAAVVSAGLILGQAFDVVGAIPFAYLMMYFSVVLPLARVGAVNDISYGMYIYAFPLQLVLAVIVGSALPAWAFVLISIALTVPFAAASWFLVEKPAMRLKRLTRQRPTVSV